jgi:hypothetical protein
MMNSSAQVHFFPPLQQEFAKMPVISHHVSRLSQRIPLEFNEI